MAVVRVRYYVSKVRFDGPEREKITIQRSRSSWTAVRYIPRYEYLKPAIIHDSRSLHFPRSELSNFTRVARLNSRASFKIRTKSDPMDARCLGKRTTCRSLITRERFDRMRTHIRKPIKQTRARVHVYPSEKRSLTPDGGSRKPGTRYVTGIPGWKITRPRVLPFLSHEYTHTHTCGCVAPCAFQRNSAARTLFKCEPIFTVG